MGDRESGRWRIGTDTGGTFTDLVAVSSLGEVRLAKVSSTPARPSTAAFEALARTEIDLRDDLDSFVLGTTIATNALIQRRGPMTLFVTTAGFEDTLFIQRIDRRGLYDLQWVKSEPYVLRRNCIGVQERILWDGSVRTPLTEEEIERVIGEIGARLDRYGDDVAVAISLLFSYVNAEHEERVAKHLRTAFPDLPISTSSEAAPIWREYERGSTVVIDAYVKPIVDGFASSLSKGLDEREVGGWRALMKSNGGQVALHHAADRPIEMVLSGLAAGMIGGCYYARAVGSDKAVSLDMGGTSADVGVVVDNDLRFSGLFEVEWGVPLVIPIVDVVTIGAGGGSIASIDAGGLLRVGPESAGADPGPACYGRGGDRPTITDANLALGRLNPRYFLGGEVPLYADKATRAVEVLNGALGLPTEDTADAIISVAIENMAATSRIVTVDRGFDYRQFDLVAFGGAGPLHAVEIARRLGMRRVVVPPSPGVLSAFGAVIADERVDRRATVVQRLDRPEAIDLAQELARVAAEVVAELAEQRRRPEDQIAVTTYVACRYIGQNYEQEVRTEHGHVDKSFELALPIAPSANDFIEQLAQRFHDAHRQAYGYDMPDQPVQSVYIGATALVASPPVELHPYEGRSDGPPPSEKRRILAARGKWVEADVYDRNDLRPGDSYSGPAIIEEPNSTTYVPPGFTWEVHDTYCLIITREE